MKRVVFVSLAAFLAVSLSAQTTDTKKDSEVELNQYGQQVNSTPGQVKIQDGIMVLDAKKIDYKMWFDIRVQATQLSFSEVRTSLLPNLTGRIILTTSETECPSAVPVSPSRPSWTGTGTERLTLTGLMEYVNSRMPFWPIMECPGLRSRQVISRSLSPSSAIPHPVTLCSWNARW